jgi:iron complex outermembrane receptor protein
LSGEAFGSFGSLSERDLHGSINVPLGSTAAMQVYAFDRSYDGFIDNVIQHREWGGSSSEGFRGKLLWQPTGDFSAYLIGDYSVTKTEGPGQLWTLRSLSPTYDPFFNPPFVNLAALGVTPGPDNKVAVDDYSGDGKVANYGASLELSLNAGSYTLTSVSAFRGMLSYATTFGIDASPLTRFEAQSQSARDSFVSQEFRVASPKGSVFEYVAGLYYSNLINRGTPQSAQLHPNPTAPTFLISITNGIGQTETGSTSAAAFVDGTIQLSDQWHLVAGGRVTHDHVAASTFSVIDPSLPPFNPPPPFGTGPDGTVPYGPTAYKSDETSGTAFSGRFGPEFRLTEDLLFYATFAHGYLGPTVTYSGLTATESNVRSQTVNDVTAGAKMQFLERRLTLNADVFLDKYKDLQTSVFNGLEFLTANAGGLTAKGFELEASYRVARHVGVSAGYTYSHAYFTDYLTSCPASVEVQGAAVVAAACNGAGGTYQAAGQALPGAPKSTLTLGANFEHPVSAALAFDAAANYYYRSEVYGGAGDTTTIQPSYQIVNLNLGIGAPDGAWRLGLFARNLFDKNFTSAVIGLPFSNPGATVNWETRDARRTVGVSLEGRF